MGQFQGPNESAAKDQLVNGLPDGWLVVHSKPLDAPNYPEVDFIILGMNNLFILEEKSWGPKIHIGESKWTVIKQNNSDERKNPFFGVAHKAKIVASRVQKIPGYSANVKGQRVIPGVLLTHPSIELSMDPGRKIPENLYLINDVVQNLINFDKQNIDTHFHAHRPSIRAFLLEESIHRPSLPLFDGFKILYEVDEGSGSLSDRKIRLFIGENTLIGGIEHLRCYVKQYCLAERIDFRKFEQRERSAISKLAHTRRVWNLGNVFESISYNYFVSSTRRPEDAVSLSQVLSGESVLFGENEITGAFLSITKDAFEALNDIHGEGVFHRAIHPSRVWIGKSLNVTLSDFYSSRIHSDQTIDASSLNDLSSKYRAPEWTVIQQDSELANDLERNSKIDSFSLAQVLSEWFMQIEALLDEGLRVEIKRIFEQALDSDYRTRIATSEILELLSRIMTKDSNHLNKVDENKSETIHNLYDNPNFGEPFTVRKYLGSGGTSHTYLVDYRMNDEVDSVPMIVKWAKSSSDFQKMERESEISKELRDKLSFESKTRFSIAKFYEPTPSPGTLKLNFVEGIPLNEFIQVGVTPFSTIRKLFLSAANLLAELHEKGIIHGDISPKNLLVDDIRSRINIIDFGCARRVSENLEPSRVGTPRTWAPEVSQGFGPTSASDIYSLAATFIQILIRRSHRKFDLGDLPEAFEVVSLTDSQRQQWSDKELRFIDLLFDCVSVEADKRPSIEEIQNFSKVIDLEPIAVIVGGKRQVNPTVHSLRRVYTAGAKGSGGSIAEQQSLLSSDLDFATSTFVETALEKNLIPHLISGPLKVLLMTGNPGGGKTSFLNSFKRRLMDLGGNKVKDESEIWEIELKDKRFIAINDASASFGDISADEKINFALKEAEKSGTTVLLAINDGKLKQFFMDFAPDFPKWAELVNQYRMGKELDTEEFLILDLKHRALSDLRGGGIFIETIEKFVAEPLWSACNSCSAQAACPILRNRNDLQDPETQSGISRLTDFFVLRQKERLNMRRIRSALAYLITGDIDCQDVHDMNESQIDVMNRKKYLIHNLAFTAPKTGDSLVRAWIDFDPARRLSPQLREMVLEDAQGEREIENLDLLYKEKARIGLLSPSKLGSELPYRDLLPYKHGEMYIRYLYGEEDDILPILKGLSRVGGLMVQPKAEYVIAESRIDSGWVVAKAIDAGQFKLMYRRPASQYLDFSPQQLVLNHRVSGQELPLTIDSFELIIRASDGEIFQDTKTRALRSEIQSFQNAILRVPHGTARIISRFDTEVLLKDESTIEVRELRIS
jgi:serine/threonine protein kinase